MPTGTFVYVKADRDRRILEFLQMGKTSQQIAQEMKLTTSTVRIYVHEICVDLGAHTRAEAVYLATERGLIKPPAPLEETKRRRLAEAQGRISTWPKVRA